MPSAWHFSDASNTTCMQHFLSSGIAAAQLSEGGFSVRRKVVDTSHDERATHYGLQGRATNVVPVTSEALPKKYPNIQDGMVARIFLGGASRANEPKILNKVAKVAKAYDSVKGHIPELLWYHTFTNPTSTIRESLGVPKPTTRSRVFYIIIFNKLYPITKLHGKELFDVWYQCILCHVTLEGRGLPSRCQSSKHDVVQDRREAKKVS
ncbi:hypothetical protein CY34DRAFT_510383 [Suillus luteus UH-Slu-Lm8-n1]|uniref:Uncharacterized protein n=1 Tax=Suillus luteus UH-Slu-Lm8-n1 TaxID=930992 RepID=A0A0D0AQK3_9AGAM|nr:hypothetical protein CY34DRAFT_510383 [Suillus luteus UH-Slu-Lm8-n1]